MRALASDPAARALNDDAAVLMLGERALVLTHDAVAEGVHYLPGQDMADVAWKLTARTLSDLAAKGARPLGVLLGYMLGDSAANARFASGLAEALAAFRAPLLGGDTIALADGAQRARLFSMSAIGEASPNRVPSRAGAQPGDQVYITSALGAAMMGYEALQSGEDSAESSANPIWIEAYCRPVPQLKAGRALAPVASAMMDISDGLLLDARRIGEASGVTLALSAAAVPIAAPEERRMDALSWGDDYALLFTAPPGSALPSGVTPIGAVLARGDAPLLLDGAPPAPETKLGYQHGG